MLHLFALEPQPLAVLIAKVPDRVRGRIGRGQKAQHLRSAELTVETGRPKDISTDGEITQKTPARFRIADRALRILAPPVPDQRSSR